jgi:hypothetical protein
MATALGANFPFHTTTGAATEPVKVSYTSPSSADKQKESHQFLPTEAAVAATSVVRTLAAKHRIRELSEKETGSRFAAETNAEVKAEIEALGVKYGPLPPYFQVFFLVNSVLT